MVEYTLHYAGDTFKLDAEEAAQVKEALRLAATGHGIVMDLEHLKKAGRAETHWFLLTPGIPVYLTESDSS
jgi:hypothetical protein